MQAVRQLNPQFSRLYSHQAEAIRALTGGDKKSVIMCTPTASGKSLPIAAAILKNPNCSAFLLFPAQV
jgi:ATP-dependent helicase YprA (DUF1998 family)